MSADEKPTVEIAAPPPWAIELTKRVTSGFVEMKADISIVANDVSITKDRLGVVEGRILVLEDAKKITSMRVREASNADLTHEAQLAQERAAREELAVKAEELAAKVDALAHTNETQLAILGRLDAVTRNPLVKTLGAMLATAVITWLATHGVQVPR